MEEPPGKEREFWLRRVLQKRLQPPSAFGERGGQPETSQAGLGEGHLNSRRFLPCLTQGIWFWSRDYCLLVGWPEVVLQEVSDLGVDLIFIGLEA